MSKQLKIVTIVLFVWCIAMPVFWLNNISSRVGVEPSDLLPGFMPQLSMIILCLIGLALLFIKEAWLGYCLVVCSVIPVVLLMAYGAVAADGVIMNSIFLAIMAAITLCKGRQNAL